MKARVVVAVLAAVLVLWLVLLGGRAVELIRQGGAVPIGLGIGVLLLPVIGAITLAMELRFGHRTQQLARELADEGGLPETGDLPRRPSGRVDRDAADAHFAAVKADVEANEQDWRGWYRLAHAYDLAGDRRRAREAMRRAIDLHAETA